MTLIKKPVSYPLISEACESTVMQYTCSYKHLNQIFSCLQQIILTHCGSKMSL